MGYRIAVVGDRSRKDLFREISEDIKDATGQYNATLGQVSNERSGKAIMARDFNDVRRADVLLVNLLGAPRPSLGTVMEKGLNYIADKN